MELKAWLSCIREYMKENEVNESGEITNTEITYDKTDENATNELHKDVQFLEDIAGW